MKLAACITVLPFATIIFIACEKDDTIQATLVKEWNIVLSPKFENPALAGRNESGTAQLQLYSDNALKYQLTVNNLQASDNINAGQLHFGSVIANGPVIVNLNPVFNGATASGAVQLSNAGLIDTIKNGSVYLNLYSTQAPAGLVRGQLDKTIDLAVDIPLRGALQAPPITTDATGTAYLRLTSDKNLFYRIVVDVVPNGDALTVAHIHKGALGINGPVILELASSGADMGPQKIVTLSDAAFISVMNDPAYVNVYSNNRPAGLIRGQIR